MIFALQFEGLRAATVEIKPTADGQLYVAFQSYNDTSSSINVGQYTSGLNIHYYVGLANWAGVDLSPLQGSTSANLNVYVQEFLVPDLSGGGGTTSQPNLVSSSAGNFVMKVVALPGTPTAASMNDAWVKTNMIDAPGVGSVTLTTSGYATVNIGNTAANWISASVDAPRWLGFVGTGSAISPYTSIKLGTLEDVRALDGSTISYANPMYLSIPEPSVPGLLGCALISFVLGCRKRLKV